MIELRALKEEDKQVIYNWPTYPSDCIELDYAVRKGGWIDQYTKDHDRIYSALKGSGLIGFSIIHGTDNGDAEFLICIKGDELGQGFGKELALLTLKKCFEVFKYKKVTLIVRKINERAKKLYNKIGFIYKGDCVRNINGKDIEFFMMEMEGDKFLYEII